eukprot:SAG31_NODE_2678_length_5265_cov_2.765389_2_plen_239_part_00
MLWWQLGLLIITCIVAAVGGDCFAIPTGVTIEQFLAGLAEGVAADADAACFSYIAVRDDPQLRTSAGQGGYSGSPNYDAVVNGGKYRADCAEGTSYPDNWGDEGHGPFKMGQVAATWYRLPASHELPITPPGRYHCGADIPGWLSGFGPSPPVCADPGQRPRGCPDRHFSGAASDVLLPRAGAPPINATICFDTGSTPNPNRYYCYYSVAVRALGCGPFVVWWIPPTPWCNFAYCLAG